MFDQAKKIAKEHGVKGFRKLKLKREMYTIGKQCSFINKHIAIRLIEKLELAGLVVTDRSTCLELAGKGLLDTLTIARG